MQPRHLLVLFAITALVGGGVALLPEQPSEPRFTTAQQAPPARTTLPVSLSRVKFPQAVPTNVDLLEAVNVTVNRNMTYMTDKEQYGVDEYWVMNPPSMKGDCEDYALTKLSMLRSLGLPIVSQSRLITLTVVNPLTGERSGHAVLAVRLNSGEVAYLDNNFNAVMTREELVLFGYEFYDW